MSERQTYSLDQIKDLLLAQVEHVVDRFAPPAEGSFTDHQGRYFTLNPGRADRSVGSFYVHIRGARAGQWRDHATGQFGDVLDLIQLSLGCDTREALREARNILGLSTISPEDRVRHERAAAEARKRRQEAQAKAREDQQRKAQRAHALWLSAQASLRGTPVERYLADTRGIDLAELGRQPRALRYHRSCRYYHMDPDTGEVIEGSWPAMLAIVCGANGRAIACHRTWLALRPDGRWDKAPVPKARKVLGNYAGGAVMLWRGIGPRGGKPAPLSQCPPDTHVYITEGIEDALSAVMLMPHARVIAAISLSNFGGVPLPPNVARVTLVADQDQGDQAQAELARAVDQHAAAGREVRVWKNTMGGKDLNDALRAARAKGVA
ncbi:DUF7146 domain-containing protein [Meridianimarinicoccus sp. RP-17]|uniref:DUF7146 domain-containing protein n=1 Tax=Meridianimarinicoccus zhengii TaxID=2056810 RepID=UPI0013A688CB|nr:toprim domain-containing protein [Phycocomes zhengii]